MIESETDLVINDMAIRILEEQGDGLDAKPYLAVTADAARIGETVLIPQGEQGQMRKGGD